VPLTINLLRPDDLVSLSIELHNLRLDLSRPRRPRLVLEQPSVPAFLIVSFQPQHICEKAYFEVSKKVKQNPLPPNPASPKPDPLPNSDDPLDLPGNVPSRMSDSSRLVFRVPPRRLPIPFNTESLLDWSDLELLVSAAAAIPDDNSPHPGIPISPPQPLETAIELPYRLILSPTQDVGWLHSTQPVKHLGRTELWHTRLAGLLPSGQKPTEASAKHTVPLRAIWSPDFIEHGPLPGHELDKVPFLSSLSARDRVQIVILTSGFDGYVMLDPNTGQEVPFVPAPVHAARLFLSALGAWLNSRGDWTPLPFFNLIEPFRPVPPRGRMRAAVAVRAKVSRDGAIRKAGVHPVFPLDHEQLDLSEWIHQATAGRDQYVRVVYEGYLYPFSHRASLVKVTERKVLGSDTAPNGNPVAYLRQRMYIIVREHQKAYAPDKYSYKGREMPLRNSVTINTKVTPDIDYPAWLPSTNSSFWINVGGKGFQFHLTGEDLAGANCDFLGAMIFVGIGEKRVDAVQTAYAASGDQRRCNVRGQKIAYADPRAGDTILKTQALFFSTELLNPPKPQPPFPVAPFLPCLDQAGVSIPALSELLGNSPMTMIELYQQYLDHDFDSNAGVFADLVDPPPPVQFAANQAGGLGRPNFRLTALSARKGLVGGPAEDAAAGLIDPAAFFDDVDAKLFGTIPIQQLIPVDSITKKANAAQNAIEIRTSLLPNHRHPRRIVTRIHWQPQLQDYSQPPLTIAFNSDGDQSSLILNAKLVTKLNGTPPISNVHGALTSFRVELFGVIGVKISSITFDSHNGSKTIVKAALPAKNPIVFDGPLSFLQTLADILPPGIFGGVGPSIDLGPVALRVAYTLGLPPLSIGVFSLQGILVMTALDLPYIDGKPGFEFGFARRDAPFLLTVECLGGGGFVHLLLNADGIQMVEGALEFGGEFSIDLGVASGAVHIMAGIYFQLKGTSSDLAGFVDIGGEVSVLGIISISIDLNLSLAWIHTPQGDKIQGRATLTISVHIVFFSISVQLSVERSFGSGSGDPKVDQLISPRDWALYASAFA
jgi:hypothetical protein